MSVTRWTTWQSVDLDGCGFAAEHGPMFDCKKKVVGFILKLEFMQVAAKGNSTP